MQFPFGFYRPDLPRTHPGVSPNVVNAVLVQDAEAGVSYAPMPGPGLLDTATALPAAPRGGVSVVTRAGDYKAYIGTADSIYELQQDHTWTLIGGGYSLPDGDDWSFEQSGDYLIFTNIVDGMCKYDIEAGGAVSAVANAPKARYVRNLFNTLCAVDCDGDNRQLRTSGIGPGNIEVWTPGLSGSTDQKFIDGEQLMAVGELSSGVGVVIQRNAVRMLSRTRDRSIFTADVMEMGVGAVNPRSVVFTTGAAYFVDMDGFKRATARGIERIGQDRVSKTFVNSLVGDLAGVQGVYDPTYNRIIWRYPSPSDGEAVFQNAIAFHIDAGEFVPIELETSAILSMATPGFDMDSLDAQWPDMDAIPYDLDSRVWFGGEPRLAILNGAYKFAYMAGDTLACTLQTGDQVSPLRLLASAVTPLTDDPDATIELGVKDRIQDTMTWKAPVSISASGRAMLRGAGKVIGLRVNHAAGATWTYNRGFDGLVASQKGPR